MNKISSLWVAYILREETLNKDAEQTIKYIVCQVVKNSKENS